MGSGGKAISGWQGEGKDGRARISCKQGFSHFIDTCIEASLLATLPSPATWPDAKDVCKPLESKVFQVGSWLVWEAVKYFLAEKGNTEPFWVGRWEDVETNIFLSETVSWADGGKEKSGSCIVADPVDLKWSRTSCNNPALFLCMLSKDAFCPQGYTPIEGEHKSCYRISAEISGPEVAGGNVHASISTANKICMEDGASLASPESAVDRDALVSWAQQQGIPLTGIVSVSSPFKAFTGLRFYKKDADPYETEKYYSPWEASIQVADGTDRAGTGPSSPGWEKPCRYLKSVSSNTDTNLHTSTCLDEYAPAVERRAVCETRICEPASNTLCTFPFSTAGRRYDKCTLSGSGTAWCSTEVDGQGVHVPGKEQDCPATCSSSICPVGFWPHLNSCLQESATLPSDVVTSVEEAEERCFKQGARLYQPRSTRSLVVLAHRTATFFKSGTSDPSTILPFANTQETAFGVTAREDGGSMKLYYRDGSEVSPTFIDITDGLQWDSAPDVDPAKTAVNFVSLGKIGNSLPDGFSDGVRPSLSYICEARPYTTLDGDDPGKACHFPFKVNATSAWYHSCVYDKDVLDRDLVWCATEVDAEGVMVPGKSGICDDERRTAVSGPDADNTCKIPFFRNGVWFENCTQHPREEYWCPTEVDPDTREQLDGDDSDHWGYCPEHLIKRPEECSENYDRIEDICVRISPYPLTWAEAESKCVSEGAHLLHILSEEVQTGVEKLVKSKMKLKEFFSMDKWSTGLSSEHEKYWIGGKVFKQSEWKWIGNRQNFSAFSFWEKATEGEPCGDNCFDYSHRLMMNSRAQYKWRAEDQGNAFPYICVSDCHIGYTWHSTARRCVKLVDKTHGLAKQAAASVRCAGEGGRLLSINSCREMKGLEEDLWLKNPTQADSYWIGFYGGGFDNYEGQRRPSKTKEGQINSRGELGLNHGSNNDCPADDTTIKTDGMGGDKNGYHGSFEFTGDKAARVKMTKFEKTDSTSEKGFLCEKERDWTCPEGYTIFQEVCYMFHPENVTLGSADEECMKAGGRVAQVDTLLHSTFLHAWLQQYNYTTVWLGHRRHTTTIDAAEDNLYVSLSGGELGGGGLDLVDFQADAGTPDVAEDDCLVMEEAEGDHSGWRTENCSQTAAFICQVGQVITNEKVLGLPSYPEILMPLDLVTGFEDYHDSKREVNVSNVAITFSTSPGNKLKGAAHFSGKDDSYIQMELSTDDYKVTTKYGLTVSAWVYIEELEIDERAFLLDASGPCTEGTEEYNSFMLWIEKSKPTESGTPSPAPQACGDVTNLNPGHTGGPGKYIKLKALLCDGPVTGVSPTTDGTCQTFESSSSMPLTEKNWEYVGFSYDTFTKKGTFIINNMYGYEGSEAMENKFFTYNSSINQQGEAWFAEGAQSGFEGPLRIGSKKYRKDGAWQGLIGRLSCLQLHSGGLSPAQVQHFSTCPLDPGYLRSSDCPFGYQKFKSHCYHISSREKTFAEAEVACANGNGHGKLALPEDYRVAEFLVQLAKDRDKVVQAWIGLDGRSDSTSPNATLNPVWTKSDGTVASEIRWAAGAPVQDPEKQCVFMDHTSGGSLSNDDCELEKPYICMRPNLKTREQKLCPAKFVAYKGSCFYHGSKAGDYDHGEEECGKVGAKVIAIKERATYQFIRALASLNKFGDFYLGLNFTHNSVYYHHNETDPNVTAVVYSDGSSFDKSVNYAFDDQSEKFGNKECAYLKKGVAYKPRDTLCSVSMDQVCEWKRPTCPTGYQLYPAESDGRTCYSLTNGLADASDKVADSCLAWPADSGAGPGPDNFLRRPGLPSKMDIIDLLRPDMKGDDVWIEGYNPGDQSWRSRVFRELDGNQDPTLVEDLSVKRLWWKSPADSTFEVFNPRPGKAVVLEEVPKNFCTNDSSSTTRFYVSGKWSPLKMAAQPPTVEFIITPRKELLFSWTLRVGSKNTSHVMDAWYVKARRVKENTTTQLTDLDKELSDPVFNLTISCPDFPIIKTQLNVWIPGPYDPRNSASWDSNITVDVQDELDPSTVKKVQIEGAMVLDYAGFTQEGCLSLSSTGLITPRTGGECNEDREAVCEHQSCYTKEGDECVFPFKYKEVTYNNCTSVDVYQPWCATSFDETSEEILTWGLCLPDCPFLEPEVSCLSPPPVPQFGLRNDSGGPPLFQNYFSDWFNLHFTNNTDGSMNHTHYRVAREQRARLWQPWMKFDSAEENETSLEFIAVTKDDHFNDVYQIMPNDSIAVYTCPIGWVFNSSNNISHTARCLNWTWTADFDTAMPCVPVFCDENKIPPFVNGTQPGTIDWEEKKAGNPERWNAFQSRLTYTCPIGFVIEIPGGRHNEQQDPIPVEQESFEVECWDDAVWKPIPLHGGHVMPTCIPINCTLPPFPVKNNDLGMYNWTAVEGVDPRPYATAIKYYCPRDNWAYPSTGFNEVMVYCLKDGTWSNEFNIETCQKMFCPEEPPPAPEGEGSERVFGMEVTKYRCKNGFQWSNGKWPYLEMECLNKKWAPKNLPECVARSCGITIPTPLMGMDVAWPFKKRQLGDTITYTCPSQTLTWEEHLEHQMVTCIWHRQTDSMIWWPPELHSCNRSVEQPKEIVVLPTLAPYPVDYPSTTSYYWPDIAENVTQISNDGLDTWEPVPTKGPFGFNAALMLDGTQCVTDGQFQTPGDLCILNPINCDKGLSFSIWEKVIHPRKLIDLDPDSGEFEKRYIFSTGVDYDYALNKSIPGFAVYHEGLDIIAIVSTGEDVWELRVRGQLYNETWNSIGIRWEKPNLDETVVLTPEERGGLELYINLARVGQAVLPLERPNYVAGFAGNGTVAAVQEELGAWDVQPPLQVPAKDASGNVVPGKFEGAPIMTFGCHYDTMESGAMLPAPKMDHFHEAVFDEMAIWTRKLQVNKTTDETLYFLGGYVAELENMDADKFKEMLKAVDMSDPDQAAAAGSMTSTLLQNTPEEPEETPPPPTTPAPTASAATGNATNGTQSVAQAAATAALNSADVVKELTWQEKEKNKQLTLLAMYKELLKLDGVTDGALPKHVDSRFDNLPVASKLLSCERKNEVRWLLVQGDSEAAGASELLEAMEKYAMAFMGSTNISFYDDTRFFTASTSENIAHLPSPEMYMSIQKMPMQSLMYRGPTFNVEAYKQPTGKWDQAKALWDNPYDVIKIPTHMWAENPLCKSNPVTFMYAIYPCYSNYAPLRRNPVEISSLRFVLDSKVVTVKMQVNNDTHNAEPGEAALCTTDPQWMKYHPVQVKFAHKTKETARRKILHHDMEIKTSIDIRRCVIWNQEIGLHGAWDTKGCTTVMTEQDATTCECDRFGTYALAAEKIEQPVAKAAYPWLVISRYIGFVFSLLSLTIFILVICVSKHLWEMFHLMRLNTGIAYWMALLFHFISEAKAIQEDRHANAAISSLILFFYLSGSYFQLMEAFAEFRAITAGIIGGKTMAYIPIGWGMGFIGLGVTWFLHGGDIGTDPDVFIGWENETKMPFFYLNYLALWTGLAFSAVVLLNGSAPQTRKEDVVEDLQVQGQGLAITNFFFVMVWLFAYPAYIKFKNEEMRDFYPVFTLFNAWMGLIIFVFLGLSSKRFRFVLGKWWARCKGEGKKEKKYKESPPSSGAVILAEETADESTASSPEPSRPVSARTTTSQVEPLPEEEPSEETAVEDMDAAEDDMGGGDDDMGGGEDDMGGGDEEMGGGDDDMGEDEDMD